MAPRARHTGILLLTLSMGCVSTGGAWSFPGSAFRRDQEAARNKRDLEETEKEAVAEREPLIAAQREEPDEEPSTVAATGIKHDPATRMLIDAELRDASPDEKQEWLAFLDTVTTEEVPGLLKERRIASRRGLEQVAGKDSATNSAETGSAGRSESEVVPAAHSMAPGNSDQLASNTDAVQNASGTEASPLKSGSSISGAPLANSDASANSQWQKKFRTLTDPNWLWTHPPQEEEPDPSTTASRERGPFGLPQIRSSKHDIAAVSAQTPALATNVVENPPVMSALSSTPSIESRITPGSALWEDEVAKLISLLEAEAAIPTGSLNSPSRQDTHKQVALRLLYLVANDPQKALQVIPGVSSEEQEFWTALFLGLSEHLDQSGTRDSAERATQTIAQLRNAAYHLQHVAHLRLRNTTFCQEIKGYGNYETFPLDQFSPGQTVLIYSEIRNFKSEASAEGLYVTRLRSTIEIYSVSNGQQLMDRSTFDPTEDRSRSLRTDYYHSYRLDLPLNLTSGPYLVKLIVQDELSGKQTTESIPFSIR